MPAAAAAAISRFCGGQLRPWSTIAGGALRALRAGQVAVALRHAEHCYAVSPTAGAAQLLAVCRFLYGDYPAAIAAARLADRLSS